MTPIHLPHDAAHVWYTFTDEITDPALLADYRAVLSAEEATRLDRFYFEKHRHSFLVSHALVRAVLSLYADVSAAQWTFVIGSHGKPEIANSLPMPLRFNLSHTQGLAAVIVALGRDVGVDVEFVGREVNRELADRYFAPPEVAALHSLPEMQQRERFFDYWTLKEAYIKARGMGLALPLGEFAFHVGDAIAIEFSGSIEDDPKSWQFERWRIGSRHKMAIAARRAEEALKIVVREARLFE